jgi:hypothetical protein
MSNTTDAAGEVREYAREMAFAKERGDAAEYVHYMGALEEALKTVAARAREEGAREATMRLKNRLIAVQMTLGDLWNRVDTFDPRMAPDLEEVVKLALEPAP